MNKLAKGLLLSVVIAAPVTLSIPAALANTTYGKIFSIHQYTISEAIKPHHKPLPKKPIHKKPIPKKVVHKKVVHH